MSWLDPAEPWTYCEDCGRKISERTYEAVGCPFCSQVGDDDD